MKYGITTHYFSPFIKSDEQLYSEIKKAGYDCIDLSMYDKMFVVHPIFNESAQKWREFFKNKAKIAKDSGLDIWQAHAIFPPDFTEGHVRDYCTDFEYDHYKKEIEAASLAGAKYLVVHHHKDGVLAPADMQKRAFEKNKEFYEKLLPTFKDCGITLAIENLFTPAKEERYGYRRSHIATADDVLAFLDYLGDKSVVTCLDTGHMNMFGLDVEETILKLGDKLKVLHLHDNYGNSDLHLPPQYGNIDWNKMKNALDKIGFNGVYSLELDGIGRGKNLSRALIMKLAKQSLEVLKDIWE